MASGSGQGNAGETTRAADAEATRAQLYLDLWERQLSLLAGSVSPASAVRMARALAERG